MEFEVADPASNQSTENNKHQCKHCAVVFYRIPDMCAVCDVATHISVITCVIGPPNACEETADVSDLNCGPHH